MQKFVTNVPSVKLAKGEKLFVAIGGRGVALFPGLSADGGKAVIPTRLPNAPFDRVSGLASVALATPLTPTWRPFNGASDCCRLWVGATRPAGDATTLYPLVDALRDKRVRLVDSDGTVVVVPKTWNPGEAFPKYVGAFNPAFRLERWTVRNAKTATVGAGAVRNEGARWADFKPAKPAKPAKGKASGTAKPSKGKAKPKRVRVTAKAKA